MDWTLEIKARDRLGSRMPRGSASARRRRCRFSKQSQLERAERTGSANTSVTADAVITLPADGLDLRAHLLTIERRLIEQALERSNGTVAHAARLLGLRRTTLVEKLRKLGLVHDGELATED